MFQWCKATNNCFGNDDDDDNGYDDDDDDDNNKYLTLDYYKE